MLKKMFCLLFVAFVLCLSIDIPSASAADQWFYTDKDGAKYYLRQGNGARSWRGGDVVIVTASGESAVFFYMIQPMKPFSKEDVRYVVRRGTYLERGQELERGSIYGDGAFAASAHALCDLIYVLE